jgi:acyl carrier protein
MDNTIKKIRQIIERELGDYIQVPISEIDIHDDLFALGLDSLNIVRLILNVEDEVNTEFDDSHITNENFMSLSSISKLIEEVKMS